MENAQFLFARRFPQNINKRPNIIKLPFNSVERSQSVNNVSIEKSLQSKRFHRLLDTILAFLSILVCFPLFAISFACRQKQSHSSCGKCRLFRVIQCSARHYYIVCID